MVVSIEELNYNIQMQINEFTHSSVAHESMMTRYDGNPLENALKNKMQLTKARGIGRLSSTG